MDPPAFGSIAARDGMVGWSAIMFLMAVDLYTFRDIFNDQGGGKEVICSQQDYMTKCLL